MLKKIRLKNFKLHEDTSIEASRINVFIGPNNSGKSSIFQALLSLRQAASWGHTNFCYDVTKQPAPAQPPYGHPPGLLIETGPFEELVRRGGRGMTIELDGSVRPAGTPLDCGDFSVAFELRIEQNQLALHEGQIQSAAGDYHWQYISGSPSQQSAASLTVDGFQFNFSANDRFSLVSLGGWSRPGGGAVAADDVFLRAKSVADAMAIVPSALMQSTRPVYPLRGFEEWGYPLPDKKPAATDLLSLSDRAVALSALLVYDPDLEEKVSEILGAVLGIRVKVRLIEGKRMAVKAVPTDKTRPETLFLNEGSGASQLPFILVPVALAQSGESILLSEPEAHLHPKMQSELTGMLLKIFRFAEGDLQFFIETHSEHVLHRLLHAVAKGELAHDDLTIYYFENKEGKAEVRKLVIDEKGGVEGGLPGFFDQSLDELSEYLEALKQPKA